MKLVKLWSHSVVLQKAFHTLEKEFHPPNVGQTKPEVIIQKAQGKLWKDLGKKPIAEI